MMHLFLKFELQKIVKYFRTKTLAKIITAILFLTVFAFVGVGIYFFFVIGFRFINVEAVSDIRMALSLFLYELFLLVLAGVIIFSSMVSGIFSLFRGGYNNWIISSPGFKFFPRIVLIRSLMMASLPSLVIFLPMVLAFNRVNHLGFFSLLFILLSVILFVIILNALTLLTILMMGCLYQNIAHHFKNIPFTLKGLIGLLLLMIALIALAVWNTVRNIDIVKLFKADVDSTTLSVSNIGNHFNLLPTHPFAMEILNWQNGHTGTALAYFFLLLTLAASVVFIWWRLSVHFYPIWQKFQEGRSVQSRIGTDASHKAVTAYDFTGGTTVALFKKELLISTRNWKGIMWFLFLFSLWLVQIGINVALGHNIQKYQTDVSQRIAIFQALQFIIAIYFISSFTLRFVFPAFSVEKKTAWILAAAPLSFKRIFFGKYLFYTSFFIILGIVMSSINVSALGLSFTHVLYSVLLFILTVIFIVTLGLSLGVLFPSLDTDDPEVVSTSLSGLFFTAFALIYGALADWILYITLIGGNVFWLVSFMVFTILFILVLLIQVPYLAIRKALE